MKKNLFVFLIIASQSAIMAQPQAKGPLDGKTFSVSLYKEGKKTLYDSDELKFNFEKFKSKYFANWGFTKTSKYQITSVDSTSSDSKIYQWTAELISDIKEKMTWSGTITGENVEGTAVMVNAKGEKTYSFTFTGKLKGKTKKK